VHEIQCTKCIERVHRKCSGIKGDMQKIMNFQCRTCSSRVRDVVAEKKELNLGSDGKLECVNQFCYLGDMIGARGGAVEASRTRLRCAWGKFRELSQILTTRRASLKVKGKIYRACVQRVLVYGSETWPMKAEEMQRLERTEWMMMRWMCNVSLKDKIKTIDL